MNQHTTEQELRSNFFSKVKKSDGCWMWTGVTYDGYGYTSFRGKSIGAHRLSWIFANGSIPAGKWVLHKCDVRNCVNPEHLYLGDIYQNNADTKERDGYARGVDCGQAKLTEAQVKEIFLRTRNGESCVAVAKDYGTSRANASRIKRGKQWTHVTKP